VPDKKLIAVAMAVAALGSAAVAGPSTAATKTSARVTIQTEEAGFSGFVLSKKSSCHSGRKVVLYRVAGGKSVRAGSDTAQPNGDGSQWKIDVTRSGKYYAKVGATSKCKAASSKKLSIEL
jgi:hypothetical protein